MSRYILPIIFIAASVGAFFLYIDPQYQRITELRAKQDNLNEALNRSEELQEERDALLSQYNQFSDRSLQRLNEMLPDSVDNVRLALDIDQLASSVGMQIRDIAIESTSDGSVQSDQSSGSGNGQSQEQTLGPSTKPYSHAMLSFTAIGTYDEFSEFLRSLENSLRLVDVTGVSFTSEPVLSQEQREAGTSPDELRYSYEIVIRTYWLKPDL